MEIKWKWWFFKWCDRRYKKEAESNKSIV